MGKKRFAVYNYYVFPINKTFKIEIDGQKYAKQHNQGPHSCQKLHCKSNGANTTKTGHMRALRSLIPSLAWLGLVFLDV